jgi:hypothetical protein
MPYESLAQEHWAHTPAGREALGGAGKVAEWDAATKGRTLPERIRKPSIRKPEPAKMRKPFGSFAP